MPTAKRLARFALIAIALAAFIALTGSVIAGAMAVAFVGLFAIAR